MKLNFKYDKEMDAFCIMNWGKGSNNSNNPTKTYTKLVQDLKNDPTKEETLHFIEGYIKSNSIDIDSFIKKAEEEYEEIEGEFHNIAKEVFGVSLKEEITAYLTINNRCPYRIKENWFFVSAVFDKPANIAMHELWHFYTWLKFGEQQDKIDKEKYNEIKESLTVLLNEECGHLMNGEDDGYPQHKELRKTIVNLWKEKKDIDYVWDSIIKIM